MALIKCPECGKSISSMATACPDCGCPISSGNSGTSNGKIQCKYCGSTDVHKPYAKALRTALFGLKNPAYGKEWYCNKCGSYF